MSSPKSSDRSSTSGPSKSQRQPSGEGASASTSRSHPQQDQQGSRSASPDIQGEGNYDATRRYDKSAREFAQSGKVDEAARAAAPRDEREAQEMRRAEEEGRSHARSDADDRMQDDAGGEDGASQR